MKGERCCVKQMKKKNGLSLRQCLIFAGILTGVGAMSTVYGCESKATLPMIVGLVLLVGGLAFYYGACRCPECGAALGRSPGRYCKHCGKAYRWDERVL